MPDDFAALGVKLGKLADAIDGTSKREIVTRVAVLAKKDALNELTADLPKSKFTNWRPKLSVGFELQGNDAALVKPRPGGPWKVLSDGRRRGRKFSRKRKRNVGWGPTSGHGTWQRATDRIEHETPGRVHVEVVKIMRKVL